MGGYLSIGLVYKDINLISKELKGFLSYLKKENTNLAEVQYSRDKDGGQWVKSKVNNSDINSHSLNDKHYLSFKMIGDLFKIGTESFVIRVNRDNDFFGFLIDIEWQQLIDKNKDKTSKKIVTSLIQLLKFTDYDYAFCGHEAEIEYSPVQVKKLENMYPILIINLKNKLELIYGEFNIDGISFQEKSYKILPIE